MGRAKRGTQRFEGLPVLLFFGAGARGDRGGRSRLRRTKAVPPPLLNLHFLLLLPRCGGVGDGGFGGELDVCLHLSRVKHVEALLPRTLER